MAAKSEHRRIKHIVFHQGVQFGVGMVVNSLNVEKQKAYKPEIQLLPSGCVLVKMVKDGGPREWVVGSGMWHYAELTPESDA